MIVGVRVGVGVVTGIRVSKSLGLEREFFNYHDNPTPEPTLVPFFFFLLFLHSLQGCICHILRVL